MLGDEGFFLDSDDKAAERVGVDNFLEGGQELGGSWVLGYGFLAQDYWFSEEAYR